VDKNSSSTGEHDARNKDENMAKDTKVRMEDVQVRDWDKVP
jgi:hypothetical protein